MTGERERSIARLVKAGAHAGVGGCAQRAGKTATRSLHFSVIPAIPPVSGPKCIRVWHGMDIQECEPTSTANGTPVHQRGAGHADALATGPCLDGDSLRVSREALFVLGCAQVGDGDAGIAEGRVLAQRCSGVAGLVASRPDPRAPDRGAPLWGIPEWTRPPPRFT
jgi:hypothetical protein